MKEDIYVGTRPRPKRGCGCMIVVALLLLAVVVAVVAIVRSRGDDPEPGPSGDGPGTGQPADPDGSGAGTPADPRPGGGNPDAPSIPDGPDLGLERLAEAKQAFADNRVHDARRLGFRVLDESRDKQAIASARELLSEVHTRMVFGKIPMAEKKEHIVRSGESLALLAKNYGSTIELIQQSNNLSGSMIRIDDRLLILQGKFFIEVDKSDNVMLVYLNDRFFKRYRVGTGQYSSTPTGTFKVTGRIKHPDWWTSDGRKIPYGHPDNLLGTHWLSLDKRGYGIHGTWDDQTIGHQASAGCVRMLNAEVEELFMLIPVGTPVEVVD